MALQAGRAELPVVPVLEKTFSRNLATQLAGPAVKTANRAGTDAGRQFGRRFGQSTERAGTDAGKRSGMRFSTGLRTGIGPIRGIMRGFGPGLAAAFGATALIAGIKSVTDEAREAAVVGKQTTAVLKSTGGVANVSAKGVANLAESISNAVGVDDELIQTGENWLLTFKNVRDEAGKGNAIFTRASKSAVDLAASMHQGEVSASGLHSANTLLGKALNDPLKGMTALGRAGVTFNAQQKEQIKTLVASGDTLGAQKIILAEVESQTKGFAAASADSGKRFGVFVANLKEQIGTALLPIINRFLEFMIDKLPGAFRGVGTMLRPVVLGFQALGAAFSGGGVTTSSKKFVGVMERIGVVLRTVVDAALGVFHRNLELIKRVLPAVAVGLGTLLIANTVAGAIGLVAQAIGAIGVAVAANPLGALLIAVTAVAAGLLFFFRNTQAGQRVLQALWGVAKTLAQVFLTQVVPAVASAVGVFVRGLMPGLKSFGAVLAANVLPVLKVVAIIIGVTLYVALTKILPILLRIAGPVLGFFFKQLGQTIQWIGNVVRFIGRVIAWLARWVTGTKTTGDAIRELGRRVGVFAGNMVKQWQTITRQVGNALSFLRRTTLTVLSFMIRLWLRWAGNIVDAAATALGWVPGIGPKLRAAQTKFHEFAASVNASLDRIKNKDVTVDATASIHTTANTRQALSALGIKGYGTRFLAVGGPVRGPGTGTSDSIPAMLSAGEHVWTAKEVKAAGGHTAVEGIRERVARGYARGGPVFDIQARTGRRGNGAAAFYDAAVEATRRLSGPVARKLAEGLAKGLSKLMDKASFGGNAGIKRFIKSVDPLPYIWGGAGPGGYDCSGLVGAVYGKMRGTGGGSGQRYFTTGTISTAVPGLKPGLGGTLNIGVTSGSGHMAGSYGGLGFEARSTATGIFTGAAARKPSSFARTFHMAKGGPVDLAMLSELARAGGIDLGGDTSRMRINGQVFDRGGWLMPGQLGVNLGSQPERVLAPGQQVIDYDKLGRAVANALAQQRLYAHVDANQARFGLREAQRRDGIPQGQQVR